MNDLASVAGSTLVNVGRRAVGPDGRTWVVRRRWAPRLGPETLLGRFRQFVGPLRRGGDEVRKNADGIVEVGCLFDELGLVILAVAVVLLLVRGLFDGSFLVWASDSPASLGLRTMASSVMLGGGAAEPAVVVMTGSDRRWFRGYQ